MPRGNFQRVLAENKKNLQQFTFPWNKYSLKISLDQNAAVYFDSLFLQYTMGNINSIFNHGIANVI